jgi:hypothetical protein
VTKGVRYDFLKSKGDYWPKKLSNLTRYGDRWSVEQQHFVLLQSCYRFLQESIQIESETVMEPLSKFINGRTSVAFTPEEIAELIQVSVDESYHSLVAFDLLNSIQQDTGIPPLPRILETNRSYALGVTYAWVPEDLKGIFLFGVVCIAENTITNDLLTITRHKEVNSNIHRYMVNHVRDEVRHAKTFELIFKEKIKLLRSEEDRQLLRSLLLAFSGKMLDGTIAKRGDGEILRFLKMDNADEILAQAYPLRDASFIFSSDPIGVIVSNLIKRVFAV